MRGIISAAALAVYGLGSAQNPVLLEDLRYAATDTAAWRIGPPTALATEARQGFISPDGKWAMAALGPPKRDESMPGSRLALINTLSRAQTSLGQIRPDEVVAGVAFSADNGLVALQVVSPALMQGGEMRVAVFSAASGRFSETALFPMTTLIRPLGSDALAAFSTNPDGQPGAVRTLAPVAASWSESEALTGFARQGWRPYWETGSAGELILFRGIERKRVDLAAGQLVEWEPQIEDEDRLELGFDFRTGIGRAELQPRSGRTQQSAVLSEDASWAQLSENGAAAIYISDAVLFLRRVEDMDFAAYQAIRKEAVKKAAMAAARNAGMAAILYASDYDDLLPGRGAHDALMPYVRNASVLSGVNWTNLGGQSIRSGNASQTELGYVQTEFGTAVIMADGSVQWRDKPGG